MCFCLVFLLLSKRDTVTFQANKLALQGESFIYFFLQFFFFFSLLHSFGVIPPTALAWTSCSQDTRILLVSAGLSIWVQCPQSSMCPSFRPGTCQNRIGTTFCVEAAVGLIRTYVEATEFSAPLLLTHQLLHPLREGRQQHMIFARCQHESRKQHLSHSLKVKLHGILPLTVFQCCFLSSQRSSQSQTFGLGRRPSHFALRSMLRYQFSGPLVDRRGLFICFIWNAFHPFPFTLNKLFAHV